MPATYRPEFYAGLYPVTFTGHELMLLRTADKALLTPIEQQQQYILQVALEPLRCPACTGLTCRRAACTVPFTATASIADDRYACQLCGARLIWHLDLFGGGQSFTLAPGQTVTVPAAEKG